MSNTVVLPVKVATETLYLGANHLACANVTRTVVVVATNNIDIHHRSFGHSYAARADLNYSRV